MLFGPSAFQLRGQMDQKCSPKPSKIDQKNDQNIDAVFDRLFIDLGWILEANFVPKSVENYSQIDLEAHQKIMKKDVKKRGPRAPGKISTWGGGWWSL